MANRLTLHVAWLCSLVAACAGEAPGAGLDRNTQGIQLQPGFSHEIVATGFRSPTAMVIAPDGRIFIAEQTGGVRVVKNGALLPTPFVSLTVDAGNERGLVGITLDPEFASNGFVYVFYTTPSGGVHNRVSRFTASGDVAQPGSELVLVEFPGLSSASNHNAGALHFGLDGKLYVAHGDNADTQLAQNLNHPFGKLHRFNRDGSIPADNPFHELPVDIADAIWAYGLRNPFTVAIHPLTGRIFANDVGGGDPEEVNDILRGANYGHGGGPSPVAPVHSYPRSGRCAITGGTFYEPRVLNFPSSYQGKYFFADFCAGEIWFMNPDGTGVTSFARASDGQLNNPVDLDVGLDGSLYYLQRGNGEKLGRIFVPRADCASDADCDDANACNGGERCVSRRCQAGTPPSCDDGNPCTENACDPGSGCRNPDNGLCNCTGDAQCNDGDACTTDRCVDRMCQNTQNGTCSEQVLPLTYVSDGGGFSDVRALTDGNTELKVGSATSPNCIVYALSGPSTVTSARLLEDNAGGWHVDTWKLQVDTGAGLRDAVAFTDAPSAMPTWNELRFPSVSGVVRVAVCLQNDGPVEAAEIQVRGRADGVSPRCGDGACSGGETCASCPGDCGPCGTGPLPLRLVRDDGGWSSAAGLTDGDLVTKLSTGTTPSCLDYALPSPSTVRSARLLEDNAGSWHVDGWKLQVDTGSGFRDAIGYTDTPRAMPAWNELDFADVSGVRSVRICMQNDGVIEAAELQVIGEPGSGGVCGDRVCDAGESCGDCPWDCGVCPSTTPGLDGRPANAGCLAGPAGLSPPGRLSEHPCVRAVRNPPLFEEGVVPYEINQPFWSDAALKTRFVALPQGSALGAAADGDVTLPPGAVTIKHFTYQGASIETRFFVRHDDGSYGAYTYRWNAAQSEAELVDAEQGASGTLGDGQSWRYPSRSQCFECHNEAAGFSLGLEVPQLARVVRYAATGRDAEQVQTLVALGMLHGPSSLSPMPGPGDAAASVALRARAYLHANCAYCHLPGGPGYGLADYRYATPFSMMRACDESSILAAYPGIDLIEPGDHQRSVVWLRASTRGDNQMPPLGSARADTAGAALLASFIDGLEGCSAP